MNKAEICRLQLHSPTSNICTNLSTAASFKVIAQERKARRNVISWYCKPIISMVGKNIQDLYFVRFFFQPYQRPEAIKIRYKQDSPWFGESVSTIHKYTGTNTQIASKASFGKWSSTIPLSFSDSPVKYVYAYRLWLWISLWTCVSVSVFVHTSVYQLWLFLFGFNIYKHCIDGSPFLILFSFFLSTRNRLQDTSGT